MPWYPLTNGFGHDGSKVDRQSSEALLYGDRIVRYFHGKGHITGCLRAQLQGLDLCPQFHKKVHHVMRLLLDHPLVSSCLGGLILKNLKCIARGVQLTAQHLSI